MPEPVRSRLQSFFSIGLFIFLVLGVSYLSWNLIQALIEKFSMPMGIANF